MKRKFIILTSCLLAAVVAVGVTVAYIIKNTDSVKNQFVPASVTCEVEEEFQNGLKTDVVVRNTGNVPAFIRATVVVNWISKDGNKVHSQMPAENVDYTILFADAGWYKHTDGFWYHTQSVDPNAVTTELIKNAEAVDGAAPDGYTLGINIIATAIQSDPEDAILEAWHINASEGNLIF